jgi:cyclopropane-fatty-acyl-phospholipid synthase
MNTNLDSFHSAKYSVTTDKPSPLDRVARQIVLSRLQKLQHGRVILSENGERRTFGRNTDDFSLTAQVEVLNPRFYRLVAFHGPVGAGEAYIHGYWACAKLGDLLSVLIRNRDLLAQLDSGWAFFGKPLLALFQALRRNTEKGSRKNIAAHYDLGNEFYQLWLDPAMMYSSAYFDTAETSLEDAASAKLDRICKKLELCANDSVVEIGTGWGGFAIHAARHYGCHVTTTTISQQQYDYARQAIAEAGLEEKITLLFEDYRSLEGRFDKLVSIEMIEAVGHEYHATYFRKCCELLKPDGQMLIQAITMADQRYDEYKNRVDFIKRYIFPGGCLTSVTDLTRTMTGNTDLRLIHLEDIGPHYAKTLRHWRDRFFARIDAVRELGYSEAFIRLWDFYLCYSESAFTERAIGNVQMLMMRPGARRERISY